MAWTRKDLVSMQDIEATEIGEVLDTAESMKEIATREIKKVPTLRGKTVVNLFYEASTRTRTSFEIAGKWLSADVINFSASGSSAAKGESFIDTAKNIAAMSPDVVVVRHSSAGAAAILAGELKSIRPRRSSTCSRSARKRAISTACTSPSSGTSRTAAWRAPTSRACASSA